MKKSRLWSPVFVFATLCLLAGNVPAANVDPGSGYTNAFTIQPPATDWATFTRPGGATDAYDMDADVNANITAGGVSAQTLASSGNPPGAGGVANWSSTGLYLQTRPTQVRYIALMGKFVNNTGSNATQVSLAYAFTIAEGVVPEENGRGTRAYYSLTGLANSWTNLTTLNTTASVDGRTTFSTNIALNWPHGTSLYLLWVDDNSSASGNPDPANQFDNFSLRVTAGGLPIFTCRIDTPTNRAAFLSGMPITSTATVLNGVPPYTVEYFTNSGAGNTIYASAGSSVTAPYNVSLGTPAVGTYNIYAVVTDSAGSPASTNSATNTFFVANPILFTLTAPADNATFDNVSPVIGSATVSGGTPPYSVQFYLDDLPNGAPVTSDPFAHNFGPLFVGDHTIRAAVTDAAGWVTNSLIHTVHIIGPLGATLTPTNGASYSFGTSVILTAAPGGGTAPYTVTFYTNDQRVGSLDAPPFTTNLGVLPVGSYTSFVRVTDSSTPTPQQNNSSTNVFTILPNPLTVSLTSPLNGQTAPSGQALALAASAAVGLPLTITNVEFFYDGALVGADNTAPYAGSVANPTQGRHTVYAVATDSLGRKTSSATNQITVLAASNNNFVNAFPLSGVIVNTTGNNSDANKEPGEPNHGGNNGGASVWWTWTSPDSGITTIDTFNSSFDTLLGVYVGDAVNQLTTIAGNDDVNGLQSQVQFNAVAGTVYRIAVDGFGNSRGNIVLHIRGPNGVTISSPANGAVFTVGQPIPIAANISTNFPNPPATRVDFYRGGVLFASSTNAPFTAVTTNSPIGTNSFYIVALDSTSQSYTSAVVNVFVQNIGVTLLLPVEGTYFSTTNPIAVTAWAYLPAGTITNIEFFVDGQKFGEDATAPFSAVWNNVVGGSHRLTAVGTSDTGATYISQVVNIGVYSTLVPIGALWKFLDNGSNQGTNWITPTFNDSSWASGPSPLGYSDSNGRLPATTNSFGTDPNNKYITTYYRHAFVLTNLPGYISYFTYLQRDDGAVVYVNGTEVNRFNMPSGTITYTTPASAIANDDGSSTFINSVNRALLLEGTNVLAVEIHQNVANTPDSWFRLEFVGIPSIIRNYSPLIAITSPTNNAYFLAPSNITLVASASDLDGSVAKVEFFADGVKLGETTNAPYRFDWNTPPLGPHSLTAVATDDQGAVQPSAVVNIVVYDSVGTPFVRITSPADGAAIEGGTNLLITAYANAPGGVTNVQFVANGSIIGADTNPPFSVVWDAPFGTNLLTAVTFDVNGIAATSAVVRITVFPNTNPPRITTQIPLAGSTLSNFTALRVIFSERVQNVDAGDLLVGGMPATGLSGSGSNYLFTFPQPPYGTVQIAWTNGHGIQDFGFPSNLPFDENGPGARWSYDLVDRIAPVIAARIPAANALITNLTEITVTFSEPVAGVEAGDLLVNDAPALNVTGGGSNYVFSISQPPSGPVSVTWASGHGIADLAVSPNAFNATGPGATWAYNLDARTILVQSNANWLFIKGLAEASSPIAAWRSRDGGIFDDSGWSNALAPFYYGPDPYPSPGNPGTLLSDMLGGYSSIYLRKRFIVPNAGAVTNLFLQHQIDDGFIVWINGFEVLRLNAPPGDVPYNGEAPQAINEPNNNGAPYISAPLPDPSLYLVEGENLLAVHAFNNQPNSSSDFGFNAQLYTYLADLGAIAPRIASVNPPVGPVFLLTNITVRFTESVSGVDTGDLLINGTPATSVSSTTNTTYTFRFPQPPFGNVAITWASNHGIADFDAPPKPFDGAAFGSTFNYTYLNPSAPIVASQTPLAGITISNLTQITVHFSEGVTGVDAADLRVNGAAALNVSGGPSIYTFMFAQPAYGPVSIGWVSGHGITDLEMPPNAFNPFQSGNTWGYTLVDQTPPAVASQNPPAGAQVTNLTEITVTFTEAVTGVNASDLLINGIAAKSVSGPAQGGTTYTFSFLQPNATVVNVSWANAHGIRDLAPVPNAFNATAPGATWSYTTPDNVPPTLASLSPPAGATVRSLAQVTVRFSETVAGVTTNSLLVNGVPTRQVSGSGAGPYTFAFLPPSNGLVSVQWAPLHGITDLASPPNPFDGPATAGWTYTLDPGATFAGKVLINEIMFNPLGGRIADEWIELHNVSTSVVNLAGWQFTRGLAFTFPDVAIAAGDYLVVVPQGGMAAFEAKYPTVTNVTGGWSGRLANSDETIELTTALGELVNSVHYASEGDWARRERGRGADPVEGITRNGTTATVSIFGHGYTGNDQVLISGADQPEYNGVFNIANVTVSTFNIMVTGTPATPATGNIICRQIVDDGSSGWSWFSAADGLGSSLELINPALPNSSGQNWSSGTNSFNGTPGRANSVLTNNVAPLLLEVTHSPAVPRSTDPVAITVRVRDELGNGVTNVTLFYRNHTATGPGSFSSTNMFDDGAHGDGVAADGLYGAVLPAAANGTVIEFYAQAADTAGLTRTWPAPAWEANLVAGTLVPGQFANALYQVDDEVIPNLMPAMRIVMTGSERDIFPPASQASDAEMNVTLVSEDGDGTKIRYLGGVRVRGAGSRSRTPRNNRLNIPNDNRWNGLSAVNLNGQFVHAQVMGSAVAQKSGVPAADARLVQYRINGVNPAPINAPVNGSGQGAGYGTFILVEPVNGDLAGDLFPEDGDGNVYRASTGNHSAQLNYQGTNANSYRGSGYFKTSNQSENDWTDLVHLTAAFSFTGPDADYFAAMSTNVNVEMWMRYFALGTLLNYGETSLFNGRGDDYALYRGINDPRFVPIGHDFDTVFGQGDTVDNPPGSGYYPIRTNASIYIMLSPPSTGFNTPNTINLRRFMTNATFAPIFFAQLKRLADTVFHPSQLDPLMDQLLSGWGPTTTTIEAMKTYAANRRSVVLSQIPLALTVNSSLGSSNGFFYTTSSAVTLFGASHAIDTRKVLVNGVQAIWSAWDARWTNTLSLQAGINRVLVQSLNSNDVEFARATVDLWYDDGSVQNVSGAIATDTSWTAAQGPYHVSGNLTVNAGATLTIQPGTTIYLGPGVDITVANGGRLLAEGIDTARIRFANAPGAGQWGGITINGGASSPETRIAYTHFEGNSDTAIHSVDGTVFLDHLTFGNPAEQYVSLDRSSFVVQDCVFPAITQGFEPVHGTGGIKAGGRGIFLRNFWGRVIGYNDALDFTGGNRPGPIVQIINNVFAGSDDDLLDLDSTDAWVEGNIFLHTHRNGSPDSASAISGGADNADTSQITTVGNLFFDVDQAANAKQGNFYTLIHNTIVHQSREGSQDTNAAVVILADEGTAQGAGVYLEGNIIYDAENLTRNVTTALVTFTNNIIYQLQGTPWSGPGGNNVNADPLLKRIPPFSETTNINSWAAAQVLWDWFSLQTGSPARGAGPNGRDIGAQIENAETLKSRNAEMISAFQHLSFSAFPALGASISGEPLGTTPLSSATLTVGLNRTGSGIPAAGFPNGSGFTHYRWRLDGGGWSAETPIANPITLNGLSSGQHYVEVTGKRDADFYQDDPVYGRDAIVSVSRTWTVNPNAATLRLNEILASNGGALNHNGTTPDAIELFNAANSPLDLEGVRLSDDPLNPDKFIFPAGASIAAGGYLVVFANNPDGTSGFHLGFNLGQEGESLYLYAAGFNGGALLDSVTFGPQLTDLSIGRIADTLPGGGTTWALTQPTFGAANRAARVGDARALRINEWLAVGVTPFENDFVELYNSDPLPVSLGGLYLSDEIIGWSDRHQITPLSFIAGYGYLRFFADGDLEQGAEHLNFRLSGDGGDIGLYLPDLTGIDCVAYQPQLPNISQGRSPNGSSTIVFFDTPTPGAPNPLLTITPLGGALVINEVLALNASLAEASGAGPARTPDWIELYNGTTNTVDLGNRSLTDTTLQPRRFVLPAGTPLAPGGYLRILCDTGATNLLAGGPTNLLLNTNFALRSAGGAVYLFDAPGSGGSLLSAIVYGLQTADLSIGRVPDGSANWVLTSPTPNAANSAVPTLGDVLNLKVNEWLANPAPGDDDWFEIYNPNLLPVALGGLWLTDDLGTRMKHRIAPLSFLGTGTNAWQQFIADNNVGAGADHVSFGLAASREDVGISTTNGILINGYAFTNQLSDVSEGRFPDGNPAPGGVVKFPGTASPGASNWRRLTNIVINEALTHTDLPLEDAIELRNLSAQPIEIGGWWLSDDNGTLRKYQIPAPTTLPANGFVVIYETVFTNRELAAIPFALSSGGDEVVLSAATNNTLTGFRTHVNFGAAANGVSFGRYITSDNREEFVAMSARTFGRDDPGSVEEFRQGAGTNNAYPRVGPIIISEIMYHPPDIGTNDNVQNEFIELRNITTAPVALYDATHSSNTWHLRDAVDFDFPQNTVIGAGQTLLIVSFDPLNNPSALAQFRAQYQLDSGQPIVGPYNGKLANDTDDIELRRPDSPDASGDAAYILVERVRYFDIAPWPAAADGSGFSLQRLWDTGFGNDPTNWTAATPSPGPIASNLDSDDDGMPDAWEITYDLDRFNRLDAGYDPDNDSMTNLQEYQAGSHPRNAQSLLRFSSITQAPSGTNMLLQFTAFANHAYSVQWKEAPTVGEWTKLADVDPQSTDHLQSIIDPLPLAEQRIYRITAPQQPGPVNPMPAILTSPKTTSANVGGDASFNVSAVCNGTPTYQWLFEGNIIPGATGPTLPLSNLQFSNAGLYAVRVSDGTNTKTSGAIPLGMHPRILTQPQSQSAQPGQSVTFSVSAEGIGPLSYRWRRHNRPLAGQTNATLVLPNVQPADAATNYSVIVTHQLPSGSYGIASINVSLTVEATPSNPEMVR